MKKIVFLCLCSFGIAQATQQINIQSKLSANSPSATLIFEIKDLTNKSVVAQTLTLTPGNNLATFDVGDVYQIVGWSLQGPKFVATPCETTAVIDHQSLIVTLQGVAGATGLQCNFQEVKALPKLYLLTPAPAVPASVASHDPKIAYKEIAKYLTALQKCTAGEFHAKFPDQEVTYQVQGQKNDVCNVMIAIEPMNTRLSCQFTLNDILFLSSSSAIQSYNEGKINPEANQFNTNIMNARCKPALKK